MNNQPIEKQFMDADGVLEVHHIFRTIQGEGPYTGERAIFIRLAGCNLQCPGCDTEYTSQRDRMLPMTVMNNIKRLFPDFPSTGLIVISGGEPTRQNIGPLCHVLITTGYKVQIESNGVRAPDALTWKLAFENKITLVVSPKTKAIHPLAAQAATCFKYVLRDGDIDPVDGLPTRALEHAAAPRVARPPEGFKGVIYINPYDEKDEAANKRHLAAVVKSCSDHGYRMGLQLHKIAELE